MGTISYPHTGMGIVAGIIFFRGYGYGIELPGGYIPVAIPNHALPAVKKRGGTKRHVHVYTLPPVLIYTPSIFIYIRFILR